MPLLAYGDGVFAHEAGTGLQTVHQILVLELSGIFHPVVDAVLKPGFPFALGSSFIMPRG